MLPESLLAEIQRVARAEDRNAAEVVADAVSVYVERQHWRQFVATNERRARAKGLSEDDVNRLVSEMRTENRQA